MLSYKGNPGTGNELDWLLEASLGRDRQCRDTDDLTLISLT